MGHLFEQVFPVNVWADIWQFLTNLELAIAVNVSFCRATAFYEIEIQGSLAI